ncbi:MAG TPA: glycosyltransferase family 9 protein [Bryobacteraceae bacterium]
MASIPASELAREILDACLKEGTWPARVLDDLIERALDEEDEFTATAATRALFGIVIERLGDLFEPALCDVYAKLFAHVIARALPEYSANDLLIRYRRIRQPRRFRGGEVRRVFVLSRVTLGADVAVTSVALAAAKERFPDAEICLVGPEKNAAMFAADPRITSVTVPYGRASLLRDRLLAAAELQATVDEPGAIVIDSDSRLTQLGLIPVCDEARYFFFESRATGGELEASLSELISVWLAQVFDTDRARPYVAPLVQDKIASITVSWGVGENADKRVCDELELDVLKKLLIWGRPVLLDRGAGGEEAERVDALARSLNAPDLLLVHDGSYASFASHILQSDLYAGYDSAGQHVAAAGNVPLVSVFCGYASPRMFSRWRPTTANSRVVAVDETNRGDAIERTLRAISEAGEALWGAPKGSTA